MDVLNLSRARRSLFNAMLEASSIGADQKATLGTLCQTNITAESERQANEQAAADLGLRREFAEVCAFLSAERDGSGKGSAPAP